MDKMKNLTRYDIEQVLVSGELKKSQIISGAMLLGPIGFIIILLVLDSSKMPAEELVPISEIVELYIYVVIALALIFYSIVYYFLDVFNSAKSFKQRILNFKTPQNDRDRAMILIELERQIMIIRYALLEGISLFAMVAIFIEINNSPYQIPTDLWYMLIPVLIQLVDLIKYFPTKEKVLDRIENQVLSKLRA